VNEDSGTGRGDVEVVVGGDGEVPHPACPVHRSVAAEDGCRDTSRHPQGVAEPEFSGFDPAPGGRVPEQVAGGGVDHRTAVMPGPDGDVVAVGVVVDEDGGDRLGLGFAGAGVGSEDLVAGFEAGDGDGYPAGEQDFGACRVPELVQGI
jgi:hypothetical protein